MIDKQDATALAERGPITIEQLDQLQFELMKLLDNARAALQQSPTTDNSTNKTWQEDH